MPKIAHRSADHNTAAHRCGLALAAIAMLLTLTACSGGSQNTADQNCNVTVNTAGWTVFISLADRLAAGQTVPREELEAFGEVPVVAAWRASQAPNVPRVQNMANWLEGAWWQELGHTSRQKSNGDRATLGRSYRYSQSHSQQINALLAGYTDGEQKCAVMDLAKLWLDRDNRPAPLVLNFVPAIAEVRIHEGEIFIDTGLLYAGGADQANRQIASLLYRNLEAIEGESPLAVAGENAIAECLRIFVNEGISGWIEQSVHLHFNDDHPTLRKVNIVPEVFFDKAQETVANLNRELPEMLANNAVMASRGETFARMLAGNNAFSQTGYAMAAVIAGRLGEEKLREVRHSVPGFLAAYQQAALQNPSPARQPGASGVELFATVPPLSAEVFAPLLALAQKHWQ